MTRREAMRAFRDAARDCPQDDWTLQAAQCAWLDHVEMMWITGAITDAERANWSGMSKREWQESGTKRGRGKARL